MMMPKTAARPQETPLQPRPAGYSDDMTLVTEAVSRQGPPPPGLGKLVDKTA
jgi:hypothetical protein